MTKQPPVTVVDAICGAGKSTTVFNQMRENQANRYMYVSPYLDEVGDGNTKGRIQNTLPEMNFKSPSRSGGKGENLKSLLAKGSNVAITHSLLMSLDPECVMLFQTGKYHIIIDETLDVISMYNGVHKDDIRGFVGNYVKLSDPDTKRLVWNYERYGEDYAGFFKDIKVMCDMETLFLHKNTVLINKVSPCIIRASQSTTILTYMFESSFMAAWLRMSGIEYHYKPLESGNGLTPLQIKQQVRDNLSIVNIPKKLASLNKDEHNRDLASAFSASWYKNNLDQLPLIKRGCESVLTKVRKDTTPVVFWTTFKRYEDDLRGRGYKRGNITTEEGVRLSPFVAKNKRASNTHADANTCLYLVNVYPHGDINSYIAAQGQTVDWDHYALSEMVQFIFRGCIRRGQPMSILIPSERMKGLLLDWLNQDK